MIKVKETFELNSEATVLVCEMFEDDIITTKIKSNIGHINRFEVEKIKNCFSVPATRNIVVFNLLKGDVVKNIEFV